MSIVVMKFGGTSIADAEKIRRAADRAIANKKAGHQVVMVVSAMGKTTDHLISLAQEITPAPPRREMDQLVSTGEQVTIALMAMALEAKGHDAISLTGAQVRLITDEVHTKARVKSLDAKRIKQYLDDGKMVIVAGFQGITPDGHITTLGRGGSNVSMVALAAALGGICENFTDVDGVYTADPRIVPNARKVDYISYDEMLQMACLGAAVLQDRAVEFAMRYNVPIHIRNSNHNRKGTLIVPADESMEKIVVAGAALKEKLGRVTLYGTPHKPGIAAKVFEVIAKHNIVVDDIIQTIVDAKTATVSFTIDLTDLPDTKKVVDELSKSLKCKVVYEDHLAKVSIIGGGMRSHSGVAGKMFAALAAAKVNIENITTSEIKVSCLIPGADGKKALRVVHDAFELEKGQYTIERHQSSSKKTPARKTVKKATKKKAAKKTTKKAARK
jgi:aspartate kinase